MKTIEILVSPSGETHLQTQGFVGADCRSASQALEQALGHPTQERLTAEFHQPPATATQQSQRL